MAFLWAYVKRIHRCHHVEKFVLMKHGWELGLKSGARAAYAPTSLCPFPLIKRRLPPVMTLKTYANILLSREIRI